MEEIEKNKETPVAEPVATDKKKCAVCRRWQSYSKKKKITLATIIGVFMLVIIGGCIAMGIVFYQPIYIVDLASVTTADNLIFEDEFLGSTINTSNWTVAAADPPYDVGGAYHVPEAVVVEDGCLNINIYFDDIENRWECGGVDSMGKVMQKYGYFEIRAKLANLGGCWSTYWLLSNEFTKPDAQTDASIYGAEIDIVESPLHPKNRIQQAIHIGGWTDNHFSQANPRYLTQPAGNNIYTEYNTYGLYWNEDIYKFYINGVCKWTTTFYDNVSDVPQGIHMTIGTIAGVNEGLKAWAGGNYLYDNPTTAKDKYSIDYVRVYRVYDDEGNKIK